jgi:hypothetical protein
MLVPDLKDGFIILNVDAPNRWWTGVECVLTRESPCGGEPQRAYLSHECRAEAVNEDPFSHPGVYEYVAASTWEGNFALRAGPDMVGVCGPGAREVDRATAAYEATDMPIAVTCPQREAQGRSFDDVLNMLRSGFADGHEKLHMAVSYRQDGGDCTLHAPCRYINFPHPDADRPYLQPISGQVLYEKGGRFHVAYVVTYIENGRPLALQFRIRHARTHEFSEVERIDVAGAACEFFVYD